MATPIAAIIPLPIADRISTPRNWTKFRDPRETDPREGLVTDPWIKSLTSLTQTIASAPSQVAFVQVDTQGASIAPTPFDLGVTQAGTYRIHYYATVTQAATVSSSLTVTLTFTDGAQTKQANSAAMTGNTTGTVLTGVFQIDSDQASPIQYSTTYVSVGGTPMQYKLTFTVDRVAA